jgi:Histidine kinase-, DNA gyrase B-, and HSP90-like ATPase.
MPDLGPHSWQIYAYFFTWSEVLLGFAFYFFTKKKRSWFWGRLLLSVVVCFFVGLPFAILRSAYNNLGTRLLLNIMIYAVFAIPAFFSFKENRWTILVLLSLTCASRELAWHTLCLIQNFMGVNSVQYFTFWNDAVLWRDLPILYGHYLWMYALLFFIFGRHAQVNYDSKTVRRAVIVSSFSILVLILVSSFIREYQSESHYMEIAARLTCAALTIVIISLYQWIIRQNESEQEIQVMDELLHQEKKHYESTKDSIEEINRKTHDLKHRLQTFEGRLTNEEIKSLQEAIKIYDSNVKTGNDVLDTVLYEQQMVCIKNGISMSCLANGRAIAFMSANHIYSLFNNAIGNAIEALEKVDNADKKVIDLSIREEENSALIELSNYCSNTLQFNGGNLVSDKSDSAHHGYGTQSMRYIVESYHGTINFKVEDDIFYLTIRLPLVQEKQARQ